MSYPSRNNSKPLVSLNKALWNPYFWGRGTLKGRVGWPVIIWNDKLGSWDAILCGVVEVFNFQKKTHFKWILLEFSWEKSKVFQSTRICLKPKYLGFALLVILYRLYHLFETPPFGRIFLELSLSIGKDYGSYSNWACIVLDRWDSFNVFLYPLTPGVPF